MYATYSFKINAPISDIISDLAAILTGAPDSSGLSASCEKPGTIINSTVSAAGWQLYDSVGNTVKVLRAPYADSPTQYKYLVLSWGAYTGTIYVSVYEDWNATTHAGVNAAFNNNGTTAAQVFSGICSNGVPTPLTLAAGNIEITSSPRHALLAWGGYIGGVLEHTRRGAWNTPASGIPSCVYVSTRFSISLYAPRTLNPSGNNEIVGSAALLDYQSIFGAGGSAWTTRTLDANRLPANLMVPFGCAKSSIGHEGGDFSSLTNIYLTSAGQGGWLDEVILNGNSYTIWANGSYRYAIRRG